MASNSRKEYCPQNEGSPIVHPHGGPSDSQPLTPRRRRGGRKPSRGAPTCCEFAARTLGDLLEVLRERASFGEGQESLLAWLEQEVRPFGIRIRSDDRIDAVRPDGANEALAPPADGAIGKSGEKSGEGSEKSGEKSGEGSEKSGEKSGEGSEKSGEGNKEGGERGDGASDEAGKEKGEDGEADGAVEAPAASQKSSADKPPRRRRGHRKSRGTGIASTETPGRPGRGLRIPYSIEKGVLRLILDGDTSPAAAPLLVRGPAVGRVILSCDRNSVSTDVMLCAECNGIVIDARTWTYLAVPPRAFNPRHQARAIDRYLGEDLYDIVQVSDGTVVTLYRWGHPIAGPIWCLSSGNGYDVSALKWMGPLAYSEILFGLLSDCPGFSAATGLTLARGVLGPSDIRLDFAGLDPANSYTLGFRHPEFHPLPGDPPGVWNIQAVRLSTGEIRYGARLGPGESAAGEPAPGLPLIQHQAVYSLESLKAPGESLGLARLQALVAGALGETKAAIAEGAAPPALGRFVEGPAHGTGPAHVCRYNYGFILRSRSVADTREHSDILIESPLLQRVRQLVYQRAGRQVRDELTHLTRLEYNALRAFLTVGDRADFLALNPQYAARFAKFKEFTANVIHLVMKFHRQNSLAPNTRRAVGPTRSPTAAVARAILRLIVASEPNFSVFRDEAGSIVHDFVIRPEYALLFLRAIGVEPRGEPPAE